MNSLTIDLEDWHHIELARAYLNQNKIEKFNQIENSTKPVLDLLDRYNVKATFFVLGEIAEKYPKLIKEIAEKGHEIASHGWSHTSLHNLTKEEFREEISKSCRLIKKITGKQPIGFRAPTYSLNHGTSWALDVLKEFDFKYDSSIFPADTGLYGINSASLYPYKLSNNLLEFPPAVINFFGRRIPIAGGFFFRFLPLWFIKYGIKKINKEGRPAILYFHPWELYKKTPRLSLKFSSKFVTYWRINSALKRFEDLLKSFQFKPIKELLF